MYLHVIRSLLFLNAMLQIECEVYNTVCTCVLNSFLSCIALKKFINIWQFMGYVNSHIKLFNK